MRYIIGANCAQYMYVCMCSSTFEFVCSCVRLRSVASQVQLPLPPQMKSACISAVVALYFPPCQCHDGQSVGKFRGRPALTHPGHLHSLEPNLAHQPRQVPRVTQPLCASGALSEAGLWVLNDTELN